MFKKQIITKLLIAIIGLCPIYGCIAPNAIKAEIQGIRNDMTNLESITGELSVWKKDIQAETINYGGSGWVVVGTSLIASIFLIFGLLLVRELIKKNNMLTMVTKAVKRVGKNNPGVVLSIKDSIENSVRNGEHNHKDCARLTKFTKRMGTFAKQKIKERV